MLFLGKKDNFYAEEAGEFIKQHFPKAQILYVEKGDDSLQSIRITPRDYIISFLSPLIIPSYHLERTKYPINFHPGSPDYPGIGCTNFAIYDEVDRYGVTCHVMAPKVDSGDILSVYKFPIHGTDTVYSLTQRSYCFMLDQFYVVMGRILNNFDFDENMGSLQWTRKAYTMKDFQNLRKITPLMDLKEINRRIKATTYPGYPSVIMEDKCSETNQF